MTNERAIGAALGSVIWAVVVAGNILRADPHLVSVYPDLVSMAIAPFAVYILGRRRRLRGDAPEAVDRFSVRVGAIAGGVLAIGLGLFTIYRALPWPLWVFASGTAFGSVLVLSRLAGYAAAHKRITAV